MQWLWQIPLVMSIIIVQVHITGSTRPWVFEDSCHIRGAPKDKVRSVDCQLNRTVKTCKVVVSLEMGGGRERNLGGLQMKQP